MISSALWVRIAQNSLTAVEHHCFDVGTNAKTPNSLGAVTEGLGWQVQRAANVSIL